MTPTTTTAGRAVSAGPVPVPRRVPDPVAAVPATPLAPARRSLAPDLARGAVLLLIALANVTGWLYGREIGPGYRLLVGSRLDHGLGALVSLLVDHRCFPMFAMLFGYGMWQMARGGERRGAGWPQTRLTLLRRNGWLVGLGLLHTTFLFHGDILLNYGVTGLVALLLLRRSTRTLLVWVGASLAFTALASTALAVLEPAGGTVDPRGAYLTWAVGSALVKVISLVIEVPTMLAPVLIGVLVGRLGLLDRPWEHTRVLVRTAVLGTAVSVLGGAPFALVVAGTFDPAPRTQALLEGSHFVTGMAGGAGYLALFALLAAALHGRPRTGAVRVIGAVGQRSMSCYLLQSVLFFGLLSEWGLRLGAGLGTAAAYGLAVAVWLTTVLNAVLLDRTGRRGPAEVLLRRLTYGRTAS